MEFLCDKRYLIFQAGFYAQKKRICFYLDDKLVYDLVLALEYDYPDYSFPVDMERFRGRKLRIECEENIEIKFTASEFAALDYNGKYRPLAHYTARRGWINDPNGLVFANGKYLMYYQHNPVATTWENMHWGLAASDDLIHWEEHGDVLFPDEFGTMFSGSGIVDIRNVSGLGRGGSSPILFFYTAAGNTSRTSKGQPFTQRLAYSLDGGRTLTLYDKPILEHIAAENRDPKVVYYEPEDSYIMALYLDGHEFALFKSANLLDWTEIQRITLENDSECPNFYSIKTNEGEIKWIFAAAADRYLIGSFDGRHFEAESEELRLNYGNASYAAQLWSDVPNNRRIRTAFANIVIPGMPFGCCMNVPQDLSLRRINGELKLCAMPVKELESLYCKNDSYEECSIDVNHSFEHKVGSKCVDICLTICTEKSVTVSVFGLLIEYDAEHGQLKCGDCAAPVNGEDGLITIRAIIDTVYTEIFSDSGSVFMGMTYIQDSLFNTLKIISEKAEIKKLSVKELKTFYKQKCN